MLKIASLAHISCHIACRIISFYFDAPDDVIRMSWQAALALMPWWRLASYFRDIADIAYLLWLIDDITASVLICSLRLYGLFTIGFIFDYNWIMKILTSLRWRIELIDLLLHSHFAHFHFASAGYYSLWMNRIYAERTRARYFDITHSSADGEAADELANEEIADDFASERWPSTCFDMHICRWHFSIFIYTFGVMLARCQVHIYTVDARRDILSLLRWCWVSAISIVTYAYLFRVPARWELDEASFTYISPDMAFAMRVKAIGAPRR